MTEWLAGNRIRGTSTERTTGTGFFSGISGTGGWKEVGRTTLGSAGDTITVSSLADKRYYMVLGYKTSSGTTDFNWRVGNGSADSGNNYSRRQSSNGGTDTTNIGYSRMFGDNGGASTPSFQVGYFANKSGKEKFNITHSVSQGTAGAGYIPTRRESVNKWTNTSLIDVIQGVNVEGGDFASGSEVVVLGWDESDTHTDNFWEELASTTLTSTGDTLSSGTFTAKKYLWVQGYTFGTSGNEAALRVGNGSVDTGSNYTYRYSSNGGSDDTEINKTKLIDLSNQTPIFWNYFIINNASNEKLMIGNMARQSTAGAGNAPSRMESVEKWTNTSNQINIIDFQNTGAGGDMSIGSTIKVWGHD